MVRNVKTLLSRPSTLIVMFMCCALAIVLTGCAVAGEGADDTMAPVTAIELSGKQIDGWYVDEVTVYLNVTDQGGSGMNATYYWLDDIGFNTYTGPFKVAYGSQHIITYFSVDGAGNFEEKRYGEIKIDICAPNIWGHLEGDNGDGWGNLSSTMVLTWGDYESGVRSVQIMMDGGNWAEYAGPISFSQGGNYTFYYYAIDQCGHFCWEERRVCRIDATGPEADAWLDAAYDSTGCYLNEIWLRIEAADNGSGVAWGEYRVDGGEWSRDGLDSPILFFEDNGTHTVEWRAVDNVGNVGEVRSKTFKTHLATEPGRVRNLTYDGIDQGVLLKWEAPSYAGTPTLGYNVYVTENGTRRLAGTTTATFWLDTNATTVPKTYTVAAYNIIGEDYAGQETIVAGMAAPPAPMSYMELGAIYLVCGFVVVGVVTGYVLWRDKKS